MKNKKGNKKGINWKELFSVSNSIQILIGVGLALFALKGFMIPNHFLDGGITGVSLLLHELFHIPVNYLLIIVNVPFIALAYVKISREIAIKSLTAIILLAVGLHFVQIPSVTHDKLLISIFGGAIIGMGMGLVMRAGAVIDGIEIIAVMTTKRIGVTISEVIVVLNAILFLIAALKFGIEIGMYALITYFTAVRAADYVVDGVATALVKSTIKKKLISFSIPFPYLPKLLTKIPFTVYAKAYTDLGYAYTKQTYATNLNNRL